MTTEWRPSALPSDSTVDAADQMVRVLDRIGDALTAVDSAALLAAEGDLSDALAAVKAVPGTGDRLAARAAAGRALASLVRCRRLGDSFSDIARALGRLPRGDASYDRAGSYVVSGGRSSLLVRA